MELYTKGIIMAVKKYMLLVIVLITSVAIGCFIFTKTKNKEDMFGNTAYANEEITNDVVLEDAVNTEEESNVTLSNLTLQDIINRNRVIVEKIETKKETIPFETIELGTSRTGTAKVLTNGSNGQKVVTYKVRYEDDVEVNRIEVANAISKKAVNKVVQYEGTKNATSRSGDTVDREAVTENSSAPVSGYSRAIEMKFTAYCLCKKCTGKSPGSKGYGVTASGYVITPGQNQKVVAVDPKVIKLGSRVYVQGLNGMPDYGYAIAADTGGAIKGNKIDLYVDNHGQAPWWTVGKVKVYVMD